MISTAIVISLPWYVWAYFWMSVVTFLAYAWDKSRARRGGRRTPEATLNMLALAWGWPGALAGQAILRHKRRKASFMIVFWLIVAAHVGFWLWYWRWIRVW
jgi:uncharacterized membrane protein YsdA (DUF1294 family)